MRVLSILLLLTVTACATPPKIIPFGKDTFSVSSSTEFGAAQAKAESLEAANSYCLAQGLYMMPVNEEVMREAITGFVNDVSTTYDLTFRCLSEDDPGFARTQYDRPDVVVERRD